MNTKVGNFPPSKRGGMLFHGIILLILAAVSAWSFFNLIRTQVGPSFVFNLLIGLFAFAPLPFIGYRAYALLRADYYIDRDSLAIIWGLRVEDIPLTDIEWVRLASDLTRPLSPPLIRFPGAVLGLRRHPDLGIVEFIASSEHNLILIATSKRVFAISPENAKGLVQTFARATEMGSLSPTEAISVYPSFVLTEAWASPVARFFWISGLILNLGLVAWVGILIPSLAQIPFGFDPFGKPLGTVPGFRLILLPIISASLFIVGWFAGLYFYRFERQRPLAFIVWISGTLSALLFLLGVLFLVTTPI